jgi:hypothetical protein
MLAIPDSILGIDKLSIRINIRHPFDIAQIQKVLLFSFNSTK